MTKVQNFKEGNFQIQVEEFQHMIKIKWLGQCNLQNPSQFLDPILNNQYNYSVNNSKRLIFDFTLSKNMNSSGVIPIIQILKKVKSGKGSIQILYNNLEKWQSVLIGELKIFETEDNRIQIIGLSQS